MEVIIYKHKVMLCVISNVHGQMTHSYTRNHAATGAYFVLYNDPGFQEGCLRTEIILTAATSGLLLHGSNHAMSSFVSKRSIVNILPFCSSLQRPTIFVMDPKLSRRASSGVKGSHYWFPAETTPHVATILSFPSMNSLPRQHNNLFRAEIIDLCHAISKFEPVRLYARPEEANAARGMMDARSPNNNRVSIIPMPVVHSWARDTGPVYVFEKNSATQRTSSPRFAIDFNFNEWGGKAPVPGSPWGEDTPHLSPEELEDNAKFAERVIAIDTLPGPVTRIQTDLTLEGGAIETDGEGTLLITESAVVNKNRNPGMTKERIFDELKRLLGLRKIISIKGLRDLDITDCHIDGVARFIRPGVVVVSRPHINQGKTWVGVADEMIKMFKQEVDAQGRSFEVHVLNEPDPFLRPRPLVDSVEDDMSLTYANFYQANGGVIIPAFGDTRTDGAALNLFEKLYPDRKVVQVKIHAIALTGGGIHCVTQQVPSGDIPE